MNLRLFLSVLLITTALIANSQNIVKHHELLFKSGIAYFESKPFSGVAIRPDDAFSDIGGRTKNKSIPYQDGLKHGVTRSRFLRESYSFGCLLRFDIIDTSSNTVYSKEFQPSDSIVDLRLCIFFANTNCKAIEYQEVEDEDSLQLKFGYQLFSKIDGKIICQAIALDSFSIIKTTIAPICNTGPDAQQTTYTGYCSIGIIRLASKCEATRIVYEDGIVREPNGGIILIRGKFD